MSMCNDVIITIMMAITIMMGITIRGSIWEIASDVHTRGIGAADGDGAAQIHHHPKLWWPPLPLRNRRKQNQVIMMVTSSVFVRWWWWSWWSWWLYWWWWHSTSNADRNSDGVSWWWFYRDGRHPDLDHRSSWFHHQCIAWRRVCGVLQQMQNEIPSQILRLWWQQWWCHMPDLQTQSFHKKEMQHMQSSVDGHHHQFRWHAGGWRISKLLLDVDGDVIYVPWWWSGFRQSWR